MGIAREVGSTNEYTIYAQSAEDYLNSHAAFDSDVEFSLNLFLRTEYGIDLEGEMNDSLEGELFDPEELIYTYDSETGKYVALSTDLLNSNFFMDTLQKGTPYFIPSLDKDRHLDFTNPKIIKVSQYKGENQLFIMGDRQLRHAEDELKHVEKPTFWQRVADGFLKIFGSRNAACENYEKFQAMMESTLKGMHKDYDKVKAFELERQEQERLQQLQDEEEARDLEERRQLAAEFQKQRQEETKGLTFAEVLAEEEELWRQEQQEQQGIEIITWPEYTRQAPNYIKRNMSAEEFDQVLKLMQEEGGKSLVTIVDDHQCKINHEALVAVMLSRPARDFLEKANAAEDRNKFLLENQESFLLLVNDFEKQVREIDLSLVDELFSRDINSRYGPGVTVGQKLIMTLKDLDVKVRNIYMDHLDKIREEQAEQERLRQEKQRKIEEATRRRDEALKRNPYNSENIEDYMNEPEPLEKSSLGQNSSDFPQDTNDFPSSNRNSWGNFADNGNDFGSVNNNPFGDAPQANPNSQPKYNPFDNPLVNPFDDAPQTTQNAPQISNPFDNPFGDPFGDAPQTTQNAPQLANPFDNPPQPEPVKQSGPVRGL